MDKKIKELLKFNFKNKKIIESKLLSDSFDINCIKIKTDDNKKYIAKFYKKKNKSFNAIKSEAKNLKFLNQKKIKLFPKLMNYNEDILIMEFIDNNKIVPKQIDRTFINFLTNIHFNSSKKFGFTFDTQIGGLRQKNKFEKNWAIFFRDRRMNDIFEIICQKNPMPNNINNKIEKLIKNLDQILPPSPKPSLLHGDLWEGNILFNNKKLVGLIDPGSFFGHNEMEIAYLRWFNPSFIGKNFLAMYSEVKPIEKNYFSYEPIYQLYYSLMNVYLWDRAYIKDVERLLKIIKI
tara:strand:- start:11543 stop:12415 length:873 start_codon:yes stop_codon:yes gene_type:complete